MIKTLNNREILCESEVLGWFSIIGCLYYAFQVYRFGVMHFIYNLTGFSDVKLIKHQIKIENVLISL